MDERYKPLVLAFISGGVLSAVLTFVFTAYSKSHDADVKEQIVEAKKQVMEEIYRTREEENRKIISIVEDITSAKGKALNAVNRAEEAVSKIESVQDRVAEIATEAQNTSASIDSIKTELTNSAKVDLVELAKIVEPAVISRLSLKGSVLAFNATSCPSGWEVYLPAQGRFLRGIDKTGSIDIKDREPGDPQEDAFQGHHHGIDAVVSSAHGPNDKAPHGFQNGGYKMLITNTKDPIKSSNYGDVRIDKETRPKNVAVLFCIKK